jgi:DNA polymerase III epsilon subunit-like protein
MNCFIDVETTGLDPWRNSVIEIGFSICDGYNELEYHVMRCKPDDGPVCWTIEAEKIHGIVRASLKEEPRKIAENFIDICSKYKNLSFICHANAYYDWNMMKSFMFKQDFYYEFRQLFSFNNYQSTISMAREYIKNSPSPVFESANLHMICSKIGIELEHHNALSDARALIEVHKFISKELAIYGKAERVKGKETGSL